MQNGRNGVPTLLKFQQTRSYWVSNLRTCHQGTPPAGGSASETRFTARDTFEVQKSALGDTMDASTLRTGPSGAALASASKASTEIPGGQRQRRSKNSKETRTVNTNKYKSINYQISLSFIYSFLSVLSISTKSDWFRSSFLVFSPCPMTIGESTGSLPTEALMELLTLWPWDGPHGCVVCLGDVLLVEKTWENTLTYRQILHYYVL